MKVDHDRFFTLPIFHKQKMSYNLQLVSSAKCYNGTVRQYKHTSPTLNCAEMFFHVFIPAAAQANETFPVIYFLSGLTCNDTNFITKACAIEHASRLRVALLCPDTSPRGADVPTGAQGEWDFGLGAGFYVNATEEPYAKHYKMYDYVTKELPAIVQANTAELSINVQRQSVMVRVQQIFLFAHFFYKFFHFFSSL